jgi:hypothetical protein
MPCIPHTRDERVSREQLAVLAFGEATSQAKDQVSDAIAWLRENGVAQWPLLSNTRQAGAGYWFSHDEQAEVSAYRSSKVREIQTTVRRLKRGVLDPYLTGAAPELQRRTARDVTRLLEDLEDLLASA